MESLFHYTSIEALACILSNRTIRFNSLNKMDDLQEQETADIRNIGQFCYVSSWTDDETESIPMWNMYASLNLGVRIKLPKNPFQIYHNTAEDLSRVLQAPVQSEPNAETFQTSIPLAEMFEKGFLSVQALRKEFLEKVEYTSDIDKLYPPLLTENGTEYTIELGKLGKYKNEHWAFQKEWRYILTMLPLSLNQSPDVALRSFQIVANNIRQGIAKQPFPYYDMRISDEAFAEMEITLSPRISVGNQTIVQCLVEKYNPTAAIKQSCLLGLI